MPVILTTDEERDECWAVTQRGPANSADAMGRLSLCSASPARRPVNASHISLRMRKTDFDTGPPLKVSAGLRSRGTQLGGLREYGREAKRAAVERAKALAPIFDEL